MFLSYKNKNYRDLINGIFLNVDFKIFMKDLKLFRLFFCRRKVHYINLFKFFYNDFSYFNEIKSVTS